MSAPTLIQRLDTLPERLRQRRFTLLPVRGAGAPGTDPQGRTPGASTAPAELSDLISSIEAVGVLQPVLAEEIPGPDGQSTMKITIGERRLRSVRWLAAHRPDNPHAQTLPAIVCPGPLTEEERRLWQLVENLAREPLRPGEQAAALLFHRCAVLTGRLQDAGHEIPNEVFQQADPVARWRALQKLAAGEPGCTAPWPEVLDRLGLQLSPRKARELVRAFTELPRELSEEMDEDKVRLHTRIRFVELRRGRAQAADEIWAAVRDRRRVELLPAAVAEAAVDTAVTTESALERAETRRAQANQARGEKLRREPHDDDLGPDDDSAVDAEATPVPAGAPGLAPTNHAAAPAGSAPGGGESAADGAAQAMDSEDVAAALSSLRRLVAQQRAGRRLGVHDANSLQLLIDQLLQRDQTPATLTRLPA